MKNLIHFEVYKQIWLNIFYSSQDMIKDQAEQEAMFSPLHKNRIYIMLSLLFQIM